MSRLRYPNKTGGGSSTTDFEQYAYDDNGNVVSMKTRAQAVTDPVTYDFTFTYDALNRRTLLDAPTGMADTSYTYDNLGRLLTANNGTPVIRAWDALGRLTSETGPLGTMAYQYDLAGRRTRQTWPDAFFVTNSWNLANEMTAVLHGGTTQIVGFTYDNLGRRTAISRSNGVSSTYGYDGASRLTSLSHDVGGTAADVTYTYAYNPAGQITGKTTSNPAYLYTPTTGSTAYTLNGLNQVTAAGSTGLTYDDNGALTNDGTRAYAFDPSNRLTGSGTATLSYDALGRLDNYVGTSGARYLYGGVEAAGFATSGTTIATRFIRGPGVDEILASYTSTGPTPAQFWLSDERGSLVDTVNGSTGVSTAINTYDEYGNPGSGNVGKFQYTGQLWLPSFGAYHYKARAYAPGLGRFLQTDPIGYRAGMNLYAYVGADPVNWRDPFGLCPDARDPQCATEVNPIDVTATLCRGNAFCIWGSDAIRAFLDRYTQLPDIVVIGYSEVIRTAPELIQEFACRAPAPTVGGGFDAYAGLGTSLSGAASVNPRNGQISIGGDVGVGVGVGGGVRGAGGGTFGVSSPTAEVLPLVGAGVNLNATGVAGPVGATGSYQLIGSNPGDWSVAYTGGPSLGGNVNVSGHGQLNLPAVYNIGCLKE